MVFDNQSQQVRETWYALREFETLDISTRSYQNRHSRPLKPDKAREITSNFIQAREYFRSAAAADLTVRPLLQYYGVATLSRGITLFLRPDRRECALSPSHGLDSVNWRQTLSGGLSSVGDLRVKITRGAFHDLLVATDNKFYFRHRSKSVNWHVGASVPEMQSEFTFQEIVARLPDLGNQYLAWTGDSLNFPPLLEARRDDSNRLYKFTIPVSAEGQIESIFPSEFFPHRRIDSQGSDLIVETTLGKAPFLAQQIGFFDIMGDVVVLCEYLESGLYFTPLAASYMSSFILGMLCRYFPTTWTELARSRKGDAVYPLIVRLLDWIQDKYPAMIVDILRGPYDFETDG